MEKAQELEDYLKGATARPKSFAGVKRGGPVDQKLTDLNMSFLEDLMDPEASMASWICMVFIGDAIRHGLAGKYGIRQRRLWSKASSCIYCVSPGGLGAFKSRQP